MVDKRNEPFHYEVVCQKLACAQPFFPIFYAMLSNSGVQRMRGWKGFL